MEKVKELIHKLNISDECTTIEAKKATNVHRSVLETVCAFSNEPGLGGGYILLGVAREDFSLFPSYYTAGIENPDKLQLDLSTQCASMFNQPIRPEMVVEHIGGKNVLCVFVPELPQAQKPVYFKSEGLPHGAYRRIGSSDQRCTDDDLFVFYNKEDSLDSSLIQDSSLEDISEEALSLYRNFRSKVNAYAEELQYNDTDLLQSLGCIRKEKGEWKLTYAGLLVFGKRQAHRRLLPMVRVDYIRVPGNEWISDPEHRFTTVDMRGPLIELVQRTFSAIADDLPKGFLLPDAELQAESIGMPTKVLREAIVNAFIHRTYRENQPIQIIRYGNRIEIKNPGFSLKPEEHLGEPGSKTRNPFISAIFHETNLAETKGSGIRTMRLLMDRASMMPPTFESDHSNNQFTIRLLLHHFLNEEDILWLSLFDEFELNDNQKRDLIFVREVGAIDNAASRQLNGIDTTAASQNLRTMREKEILSQKGKGRYTYYIPNEAFALWKLSPAFAKTTEAQKQTTEAQKQITEPLHQITEPAAQTTEPSEWEILPAELRAKIDFLGKKASRESIEELILEICNYKPCSPEVLAKILNRQSNHIYREYIKPLKDAGKLGFTIPEMPNHPDQAYKTIISNSN